MEDWTGEGVDEEFIQRRINRLEKIQLATECDCFRKICCDPTHMVIHKYM